MVADGRGQLYFCDIDRNRVWKLDAEGRLTTVLTQNHCHTLLGDAAGNIYGEDIGAEGVNVEGGISLWKLTPEGQRTFILPPTTKPEASIGIVRDAEGNTYQWESDPPRNSVSRILKRSADGTVTVLAGSAWGFADGSASEAKFANVGGMAAGPEGALYVAEEKHLRRVAPDGRVTTLERDLLSGIVGGLPGMAGLFNRHMGVTVDTKGNVYVVDYGAGRVIQRTPDGMLHVLARSGGIANAITCGGWGWKPVGFAISGNEMLLLEEWPLPGFLADAIGTPRVSRILPKGGKETVVSVWTWPARGSLLGVIVAAVALTGVWARRRRRRR